MLFSQITTEIGKVSSIKIGAKYINEPLKLFTALSENKANCLLLESAEIDSKDELKSLMLIDAAVKFTCRGNLVEVLSLGDNGKPVLESLAAYFNEIDSVALELQNTSLQLEFSNHCGYKDEESRLKQINAFEALRAAINCIESPKDSPFSLFLGGVFSYDMLANFEQLPDAEDGPNSCEDFNFYLAETLVVVDHKNQTTELLGNVFSGADAYANCFTVGHKLEEINKVVEHIASSSTATPESYGFDLEHIHDVKVNVDDESFKQQVDYLKQHIVTGDIFQVVPSRCFSLPCQNSIDAYRHLKQDNPSPYMFYLKTEDYTLFGASPESAIKYGSTSNQVEVYPIAGTRKRGFNADGSINLDLDSRIELDLRNDDKEVAEHMMLVDLARNDVARISETGTRHTKELLKVDRYSYVMHLVSRVVGQLRNDLDALHAYQASMNMGTLVGAPKIKAASLIRQVEKTRRGSYGGAVGYLTGHGDMDTCIVIRSAFVKNDTAYIQAGAGVVYDSVPESECAETLNKATAVIRAVQASESLIKQQGESHA